MGDRLLTSHLAVVAAERVGESGARRGQRGVAEVGEDLGATCIPGVGHQQRRAGLMQGGERSGPFSGEGQVDCRHWRHDPSLSGPRYDSRECAGRHGREDARQHHLAGCGLSSAPARSGRPTAGESDRRPPRSGFGPQAAQNETQADTRLLSRHEWRCTSTTDRSWRRWRPVWWIASRRSAATRSNAAWWPCRPPGYVTGSPVGSPATSASPPTSAMPYPGRFFAAAVGLDDDEDPWRVERLTWAVLDVLDDGGVDVPGLGTACRRWRRRCGPSRRFTDRAADRRPVRPLRHDTSRDPPPVATRGAW